MEENMITIEELLQIAADNNASDVHITVGVPPKMRVNGVLISMDYPRLMPEDTDSLIDSILDRRHREIYEEYGERELLIRRQVLHQGTAIPHAPKIPCDNHVIVFRKV